MKTSWVSPSVEDVKKPLIVVPQVKASNDAVMLTRVSVRGHEVLIDEPREKGGTDLAPTPLETLLASLVGCEAVILKIAADAMRFSYSGVDIECEGEADLRGARGVTGVRPYFSRVRMAISISTIEPPERLALLQRTVEQRCPVLNLFRDAGVALSVDWISSQPEQQA